MDFGFDPKSKVNEVLAKQNKNANAFYLSKS